MLNDVLHTDIKPTYIDMPMSNYVDRTLADITKIKTLKYQPRYTLTEGVNMLASEYQLGDK
jgi:nucleoside-diphosphate-sugar epimerase